MGAALSNSAEEPPAPDIDDESVAASVIQKSWKKQQTDFKWPENLAVESIDMADLVTLSGHLHLLFETSAKSALKGMEEVEEASGGKSKLTLAQIQSIVENNKDALDKHESMLATLSRIGERTSLRKVAVVALDMPKMSEKTPFFFLVKDDKLKRITLAFTPSAEYNAEWTTKSGFKMVKAPLKRALKAKISGDRIAEVGVHAGFYDFLFAPSKAAAGKKNEQSPDAPRKYDDIKESLKAIFENFPKHRLYVTGQGSGAGLAHMAAFFLTFDSDIAKPISCLNFGASRLGDQAFWRACQLLEIAGKLRTGRFQVEDDAFCANPSAKEYVHASYAIKLVEGKDPQAVYPNVKNDHVPRPKLFGKKPKEFLTIDDYVKALEGSQEKLKTMDLNSLYNEMGASNFSLGPAAGSVKQSASSDSLSLKNSNKSEEALKEEPEKEAEEEAAAEKSNEEETAATKEEETAATKEEETPKAEE